MRYLVKYWYLRLGPDGGWDTNTIGFHDKLSALIFIKNHDGENAAKDGGAGNSFTCELYEKVVREKW